MDGFFERDRNRLGGGLRRASWGGVLGTCRDGGNEENQTGRETNAMAPSTTKGDALHNHIQNTMPT